MAADAAIFVSSLDAGKSLAHQAGAGRKAYLFVIAGEVNLNGQVLSNGDQARLADETDLKISAAKDSELLLIDLP